MTARTWKLQFASFAITCGDYFSAMGIPLIEGRTFTENDRADTPLVVMALVASALPAVRAASGDPIEALR